MEPGVIGLLILIVLIAATVGVLVRQRPDSWNLPLLRTSGGGGALLKGMPEHLVRVAQMDVRVVADPLGAVTRGLCAMLPIASTLQLFR